MLVWNIFLADGGWLDKIVHFAHYDVYSLSESKNVREKPALFAGGLIPAFLIYRTKILNSFSIRKKVGIRPPAKRARVLVKFFWCAG